MMKKHENDESIVNKDNNIINAMDISKYNINDSKDIDIKAFKDKFNEADVVEVEDSNNESKKRKRLNINENNNSNICNDNDDNNYYKDADYVFEYRKNFVVTKRLLPIVEKLEKYILSLENDAPEISKLEDISLSKVEKIEENQIKNDSVMISSTGVEINNIDYENKKKIQITSIPLWPYNKENDYSDDVKTKQNLVLKLQNHRLLKGQKIPKSFKYPRTWSHHDALLEEMHFMAIDFHQESLFKKTLLKNVSTNAKERYKILQLQKNENSMVTCSKISSLFKDFWLKKLNMKREINLFYVGNSGQKLLTSKDFIKIYKNNNNKDNNKETTSDLLQCISQVEDMKIKSNTSINNVCKSYHQLIDGLIFSIQVESDGNIDQIEGICNYISSTEGTSLIISIPNFIDVWESINETSKGEIIISKLDDILLDPLLFTQKKWKYIVFDIGVISFILSLPELLSQNIITLLSQLISEKTIILISPKVNENISKRNMILILSLSLPKYIDQIKRYDSELERIYETIIYTIENKVSHRNNDKLKFNYTVCECKETILQSIIRSEHCGTYDQLEKCCNHPELLISRCIILSSKIIESIAYNWCDSLYNNFKCSLNEYKESDEEYSNASQNNFLLPKTLANLLYQYELGAQDQTISNIFKRNKNQYFIKSKDIEIIDSDISQIDSIEEKKSFYPYSCFPSIGHETLQIFKVDMKPIPIEIDMYYLSNQIFNIIIPPVISIPMNRDSTLSDSILLPEFNSKMYSSGKLKKLLSIILSIQKDEKETDKIVKPTVLIISRNSEFLDIINCAFNNNGNQIICERVDDNNNGEILENNKYFFSSPDDDLSLNLTQKNSLSIGLCLESSLQNFKKINKKVYNLNAIVLMDTLDIEEDFIDNMKKIIGNIIHEKDINIKLLRMMTKGTIEELYINEKSLYINNTQHQTSGRRNIIKNKSNELLDCYLDDDDLLRIRSSLKLKENKINSSIFDWESCHDRRSHRRIYLNQENNISFIKRYSPPLYLYSHLITSNLDDSEIDSLYNRRSVALSDENNIKINKVDEIEEAQCFYSPENEISNIQQNVQSHFNPRDLMLFLPHNIEKSINESSQNEIHWIISSRTPYDLKNNNNPLLGSVTLQKKRSREDDQNPHIISEIIPKQDLQIENQLSAERFRSESLIDILTTPIRNNIAPARLSSPILSQPDKTIQQQQQIQLTQKKKREKSNINEYPPTSSSPADNISEAFTIFEDNEIIKLHQRYGENWGLIADSLNRNKMGSFMVRSGKQVSERYFQIKNDQVYKSNYFPDFRNEILLPYQDQHKNNLESGGGFFFLRGMQ